MQRGNGERNGVLLLVLALALGLAACGGGAAENSPQRVAAAVADAVVAEDYRAALDWFVTGTYMSEADLVDYRNGLVDTYGPLSGAVVEETLLQEPSIDDDEQTIAVVSVVWQLEQTDLQTAWVVLQAEDAPWQMDGPLAFGGAVEGRLVDGTFVPDAAAQEPATATPPTLPQRPVPTQPTPTPAPTPTPSSQPVTLQVEAEERLLTAWQDRFQVTLNGEPLAVTWRRGRAQLDPLPLGSHTIGLTITGRTPQEATVDITPDAPPPPVVFGMGEPLPLDPATTLLRRDDEGRLVLQVLTPDGLDDRWRGSLSNLWHLRGWTDDLTGLHVVTKEGVGQVDSSGMTTWAWELPDGAGEWWAWNPDTNTVAYVQEGDVLSLALDGDGQPDLWTTTGDYDTAFSWIDQDRLMVSSPWQVLNRDGTGYEVPDGTFLSDPTTLLWDGRRQIGLFYRNGTYSRPAETERQSILEALRGPRRDPQAGYGWSSDNQYLFVQSGSSEETAESGVLALDRQGGVRQVAPQLTVLPNGNVPWGPYVMEPFGSRMALGWNGVGAAVGKGGLYVLDGASGTATRLTEVVPAGVFWPTPDTILYTVGEGDNQGTWRLSVSSGEAERVLPQPIVQGTETPDGVLLLVADNTLWRVDPGAEPVVVGEPGSYTDTRPFVWPDVLIQRTTGGSGATGAAPAAPTEADPVASDEPTAAQSAPGAAIDEVLPVSAVWASQSAEPAQDSAGNTVTYGPENLIDGDPTTAWRVAGDGSFTPVLFMFDAPVEVSAIDIIAGYAKVDDTSGVDRFTQNRRVKRVQVTTTNGTLEVLVDPNERLSQLLPLPLAVTNFVRLDVLETTPPGEVDGRDFTAISDVRLVGRPCTAEVCGAVLPAFEALLAASPSQTAEGLAPVEALQGDWARVLLRTRDPLFEPAWGYWQQQGDGWVQVFTAGGGTPPAQFDEAGIPEEVRPWQR